MCSLVTGLDDFSDCAILCFCFACAFDRHGLIVGLCDSRARGHKLFALLSLSLVSDCR